MAIPSASLDAQLASPRREGGVPDRHTQRYSQRGQSQLGFKDAREKRLAHALGWFSVGLGVMELIAPRRVGKFIGVGGHSGVVRLLGAREIVSGIGILSQRKPEAWLWSRVGGDLIDLTLLGLAMRSQSTRRSRVAGVAAAVAGITALDLVCSQRVSRHPLAKENAKWLGDVIHIQKSIVVNRSPEVCYGFWRNVENLPRFMSRVESIKPIDHRQSRWIGKARGNEGAQWDSEITHDVPNQLIAWRCNSNDEMESFGPVRFAPMIGGRGTLVKVDMKYRPKRFPTSVIAELFGESPEQQLQEDLRRFKQLIETGEIPRTQGQSSGRRSAIARVFSMWRER